MPVRLRATGAWTPDQVRTEWVESSRPIIESVERAIDEAWRHARQRPGVLLFDGPMCRLERWRATPHELHLSLSRTSYKTFLGTNVARAEPADAHGANVLANPVGLSAALVTADERLLLGRRGPNVAYYPGRVHPFAGALEPRDGPIDVFAEMRRELREELSLAPADLGAMRCIGLIEDAALRQPELVFHVHVARPHERLVAAVDSTEHEGVVVLELTDGALRRAARDPSYTPVAVGTVLLLGRERFGDEWFNDAIT